MWSLAEDAILWPLCNYLGLGSQHLSMAPQRVNGTNDAVACTMCLHLPTASCTHSHYTYLIYWYNCELRLVKRAKMGRNSMQAALVIVVCGKRQAAEQIIQGFKQGAWRRNGGVSGYYLLGVQYILTNTGLQGKLYIYITCPLSCCVYLRYSYLCFFIHSFTLYYLLFGWLFDWFIHLSFCVFFYNLFLIRFSIRYSIIHSFVCLHI